VRAVRVGAHCWLGGLILLILLAGCGGGNGSETAKASRGGEDKTAQEHRSPPKVRSLTITLAGLRGPESAGIVHAYDHGYFADLGLDVTILSPADPVRPIKYVVSETDDLGVAQQPQVVLAKEKGVPIVAFGSLIPKPTAAMIWLKRSGIDGIADLKGKTIAIPGLSFQEGLLETVLARAGLTLEDVTVEDARYELVDYLASGRADAIFGGSWNAEGIVLESRGLNPVITRLGSLGIPSYEELVFIARTDRVAREPQTIRDFMAAVRRGTAAIKDPEEAAEEVLYSNESTGARQGEMEAEIKATLPLFSRTGYMSPARADRLVDWMREEELIEAEPPASELLTNRYLLPEAPGP
jgi:putative hydroxymethylpyrimidine transport system substrate-binding protein